MTEGIYEELVSQLVAQKLSSIDKDAFYVQTTALDKIEAATVLSKHLAVTIKHALSYVKAEQQIEAQIEIANKIILFLKEELNKEEFNQDLIATEGQILKAVFSRVDAHFADFELHLKEITPYTRLTHSELFTGGNVGLSLESELKKEILSSNQIDLLVSFIKFKGIIIHNPSVFSMFKLTCETLPSSVTVASYWKLKLLFGLAVKIYIFWWFFTS
jgi:hypothetical protein